MKTIGIIGLGSIGLRHAENLQSIGHNWVFHDPAKDASMSMERIFAEDVDGVVIASPTPDHLDHLVACVLAGKPTLIEKPIAADTGKPPRNLTGALHVAKRDGVPIMVGYNLRFHSCVKKAKEWLDAGLIGKPIWSNFTLGQYNDRPPYLRDGVILNWSHEIDLCLYLLGGASLVASSTRLAPLLNDKNDTLSPHDDMTDILLTHEKGCRSTVHLDYISRPEVREFIIVGENGSIEANLVDRCAWIEGGEVFRGQDTWNDNYIEEMQAFIDRIDGKERIGCTGAEGLEVLKICLEVRKQAGLE